MKPNEDLLETLLELQNLDRVARSGYELRGVSRPESVAEHGWHLAFLVWAVAPAIDSVDVARAIEIALIHDVAEVRPAICRRPRRATCRPAPRPRPSAPPSPSCWRRVAIVAGRFLPSTRSSRAPRPGW